MSDQRIPRSPRQPASEIQRSARPAGEPSAQGPDKLLLRFLREQWDSLMEFADGCDRLDLTPLALNRFHATFTCNTLLENPEGVRRRLSKVLVEIWLPESYLRRVDSLQVISVLEPRNIFLANVRPPLCCIGVIRPSTPLTDLVSRIWEVLAGQNVMPNEFDALNPFACGWIRNHPERFPLDTRPLTRGARPAPRQVYTPLDETADTSGWEIL
jgi:hypothetical protein